MTVDPRYGTWRYDTSTKQYAGRRARSTRRRATEREPTTSTTADDARERHSAGDVGTRVVVVGLGPAGADLLLPAARAAFERVPVRFARTARHPAVDDLAAQGIDVRAARPAVRHAATTSTRCTRDRDRTSSTPRTTHGEIVYAVPGSPNVAERSVRAAARRGRRGRDRPRRVVRRSRVGAARDRPAARCARRRRARVRDRRGRLARPDAHRAVPTRASCSPT